MIERRRTRWPVQGLDPDGQCRPNADGTVADQDVVANVSIPGQNEALSSAGQGDSGPAKRRRDGVMWALWTRANGVPVSEFFTLHLKWRACIKVIPIKII